MYYNLVYVLFLIWAAKLAFGHASGRLRGAVVGRSSVDAFSSRIHAVGQAIGGLKAPKQRDAKAPRPHSTRVMRVECETLVDAATHRQCFRQATRARRLELVEDYVELIADLIDGGGEARHRHSRDAKRRAILPRPILRLVIKP